MDIQYIIKKNLLSVNYYLCVRNGDRIRLLQKDWKKKTMPSTIHDVARLAGVSPSTVSKYINGGSLRPKYRQKVQQAIEQLDFKPNSVARSLKSNRTYSVGVILPSLSNTFCATIISAFEKGQLLRDVAVSRVGLQTSNNNYFLRVWFECAKSNSFLDCTTLEDSIKSDKKWYPHNKGGAFRKWYGNQEYVRYCPYGQGGRKRFLG